MPRFSIQDLAKIIERESKSATYKFTLLRATIEIIHEQEHYLMLHEHNTVSYPMGSMILKWIRYYYPTIVRNPDDPTGGVRHVIQGKGKY